MRFRVHRLSLGNRLTGAFLLAAVAGGLLGGLLFTRALLLGLDNGLDVTLRMRAQTLTGQLIQNGRLQSSAVSGINGTTGFTQVLTGDGSVLSNSTGAGSTPLLDVAQRLRAARGIYIVDAQRTVPASAGSAVVAGNLRILGAPLGATGDLVVVAASHDTVDDAVQEAVGHLVVIGLVTIGLAGLAVRALIRAALRPVERTRARAERASSAAQITALPVPAGDDEFTRLVATFNGLLTRQQLLLEAARSFTADAGHELRTPLAILSGELELAARPGRSVADLREAVAVAREETARLVQLTESLLVLAQGDSQSLVHLGQADVRHLVAEAVAMSSTVAAARDVTVRLQGPPDLRVDVDSVRLRQAVDNLLSNALRYAPAGTAVDVWLDLPAIDRWQLTVRDRGPGFPPEFLPHAFERFSRGDQARTRGIGEPGSGLGLAIVSSIVLAHGGTVVATNADPGPGAVVGFTMPTTAIHRAHTS